MASSVNKVEVVLVNSRIKGFLSGCRVLCQCENQNHDEENDVGHSTGNQLDNRVAEEMAYLRSKTI